MGLVTENIIISGSSTASFALNNLPSASSLTNILVYNSASGLISYTSSAAVGGGSGTPGGSDTQIQFNNGGNFGGDSSFTFIVASQSLKLGDTNAIALGQYSFSQGSDTDALGDSSHAQGNDAQAVGNYSHAEGASTQAIGNYSHAEGNTTQAIGETSHAEGSGTYAIGQYSHAEGSVTQTGTQNAYYAEPITSGIITLSSSYSDVSSEFASDGLLYLYDRLFDNNYNRATFTISQSYFSSPNTIVELYDTSVTTTTAYVGNSTYGISNWTGDQTIPGTYSHTEGSSTYAIGQYSHAEGQETQAIGEFSHAEGSTTQAIGVVSHTEGANTLAIGIASHAEGVGTIALGPFSHTEGQYTTSSGDYSHAEGYASIASGSNSHAEGGIASTSRAGGFALGEGSHAEGDRTQAIGEASHAEGTQTQAIGQGSHAEGLATIAIGGRSHAEGVFTIASGSYQTVVGSYNAQNNTDSKFIVGIGDATLRKDGFTVDADTNLSGSIMIPTNAANPSTPKTGSMYFNPSTNLLYIYNGTAWRSGSFA